MRSATKKKIGKDPEYLEWIREQPCRACLVQASLHPFLQRSRTEAAHVGKRGLSQKCPDREAIPLCGFMHHREGTLSAHHLQKQFWTYWGIDRDKLIRELNEAYEAQR